MAIFTYTAIDAQGQTITESLDGLDENDIRRQLRSKSLHVLEVFAGEPFSFKKLLTALKPSRYLSVKDKDRVQLYRQMALMLRSGHTVVQTLKVAVELTEKWSLQHALSGMASNISGGSSLSGAMTSSKIFDKLSCKLVEAGEAAGDIDSVFEKLAVDVERSNEIKRKLRGALIYPAITLIAAIAVIYFLVTSVVPKFMDFLEGKTARLPPSTEALISMSKFVGDYKYHMGIGIAIFVFLIMAAYTQPWGKRALDAMMLRFPVLGKTIVAGSMAQFSYTLSLLLHSGLTALQSLRVCGEVLHNQSYRDAMGQAAENILEGESLSGAMDQPIIPKMVRQMVHVGEEAGELEHVMNEVGLYYQKDLQIRLEGMTSMIEPVMTLLIGGLVGFVYLSFFQAVMAVSTA